jgi:hypothetical protein
MANQAPGRTEVRKWIEEYIEKKGSGVKGASAAHLKGYVNRDDINIKKVNELKKHVIKEFGAGRRLTHSDGRTLPKNLHRAIINKMGIHDEVHDDIKEWLGMEKASKAEEEKKAETEEKLTRDLEEKEEEELTVEEELKEAQLKEIEDERKRRDEEAKKREKWRRLKWTGGKLKTTAKGIHSAATLGSGWIGFFLLSALVIWFFDASYGYIGPTEFSFVPGDLWNIAAWTVFLVIMVYHIISNWGPFKPGEWITYGIAIATVIFVMITGSLNRLGFVHLIFIGGFWWVIINDEAKDKTKANLLLSAFIIIDFYRFVILKEFFSMTWVAILMRIPVLLIGTIVGLRTRFPKERLPKIAFFILFVVIAALNGGSLIAESRAAIGREEGVAVIGPVEVFKRTLGEVENFWADLKRSTEQQLEYATGGYYKGKVEENEKAQLGVYIENLQAADRTFYSGEQVVIWGDLKARTLDQPINVSLKCGANGAEGDVLPKGEYEIERLEDLGFECRIPANKLKNGSNTINITVEFNFKTLAFLKTYLMHRDRIRALRKENIDPLTEYGIIDKTPTAVYTNGPIRLGMGTIEPPVGLIDDTSISFIGVTVENQWQGHIKEIKQLEIQIPTKIPMEGGQEELYCRNELKKIGEEEGYSTYRLTEDYLKKIKTPITTYRSWRCTLVNLNPNKVLGNTPITTYYYRANVDYVYSVGKTINVYVKPQPGVEKTKLTSCVEVCGNNAGCICDKDDCKIAKGAEIKLGENCNKEREAVG